ncbi:DUF3592 domain-containing protein [Pseudonocardia humida]|uniref:DUF3592 domain-containing protein n=1 Tax=Pseudonocardia humida TaxID=2800819 RepID=A0ABT1ADY3_9PSEU|nr:DUF3592 domain-containing protein [Pseudonocardia humida]MCO1661146.1 hypothetical protein [Pseudonocardia humida]
MSSGTPDAPPDRTTVRAVDELADLLRPALRHTRRRLPEVVAGLAVLAALVSVLALVGAWIDDRAIAANPAVAQAEVLDGSSFARTLVRFTVANGEAVVPELGVYYPRGLEVGQTVAVEYDVTNPDHVRVAGRSVLDGVLPLLLLTVGSWAVLVPTAVWLRRRRARSDAA